jgi:hypothetical protein
MITKLITSALDPMRLVKASTNARVKIDDFVTQALTAATRDAGQHADPVAHRHSGSADLRLPLISAMRELDDFMRGQIGGWRKSAADVSEIGRGRCAAFAEFRSAQSHRVRLTPITAMGRAAENLLRRQRGYDMLRERLQYEYEVRFDLAGGQDRCTVSHQTTETIDPFGQATRDIHVHFRAPRSPRRHGEVGQMFLERLRRFST